MSAAELDLTEAIKWWADNLAYPPAAVDLETLAVIVTQSAERQIRERIAADIEAVVLIVQRGILPIEAKRAMRDTAARIALGGTA